MPPLTKQVEVIDALIDQSDDDDLSAEADLGEYTVVGFMIPPINSANVSFLVCHESGGTFWALKGADGVADVITATTGSFYVNSSDLELLKGYRFVKVATSASQSADRTFKFIVKRPV